MARADLQFAAVCIFASFVPITLLLGLAYLVWRQSDDAAGTPKTLGRALTAWMLLFCLGILGGSIRATVTGTCPLDRGMGAECTDDREMP